LNRQNSSRLVYRVCIASVVIGCLCVAVSPVVWLQNREVVTAQEALGAKWVIISTADHMRGDVFAMCAIGGPLLALAGASGLWHMRRFRAEWHPSRITVAVLGGYFLPTWWFAQGLLGLAFVGVIYDKTTVLGDDDPIPFGPYFIVSIILLVFLWVALFVPFWRARRRYKRTLAAGPLCIECGYDLTGNISGVCPECGEPTPQGEGAGARDNGANRAK
jgi:hypothetical protein